MARLRDQVSFEQYNDSSMDWNREGDKNSPYRQFIARHLLPFIGDVRGRAALDVGCGTGWLLHMFGQLGAARLVGVEPSHYAKLAAHCYPETEITQATLDDFKTDERFDLLTFVMSTEVIDDLVAAFDASAERIKSSGRVVICKGNYTYFCADKYDYTLTREDYIPGHETVVKTERPGGYGTTIDIYRSSERVVDLAAAAGLELSGDVFPFGPDEQVMKAAPRYALFAGHPIMELLEFRPGS